MFEIADQDANTRILRVATVEELEQQSLQLGWDAHYTQLGSSSRPGHYLESVFDSIMVTRTVYPGPMSLISSCPRGYVVISMFLSSSPAKIKGVSTGNDRLFVGSSGLDYEVITRGFGDGFTIVMSKREIESRLGASCSILEKAMSRASYCSADLDAVELYPLKHWYQAWIADPLRRDEAEAAVLQRSFHDALTATLSSLLDSIEPEKKKSGKDESGYGNIACLIDYFHACPDEHVALQDMIQMTGLRRRNLFYQFKKYTGYTPQQYFRRLRLGFVRKELLAESGPVTSLALKYNFNHLGEFSALYKRVYDESPSESRQNVHPEAIRAINQGRFSPIRTQSIFI